VSNRSRGKKRAAPLTADAGAADLSRIARTRNSLLHSGVPLPLDEQNRLLRLLERTLGHGFKLAVVEVSSPKDREAVIDWLRPHLRRLDARVIELDVAELSQGMARGNGPRFSLWGLLDRAVPGEFRYEHCALTLWGFEALMYQGSADRSELLQQINIERDLLVRDFPCLWLLFMHPASRQHWNAIAPDFCDFVACWVESPIPETRPEEYVRLGTHQDTAAFTSAENWDWPEKLEHAADSLALSRYDEALDMVHTYRAEVGDASESERGRAIADLVEAHVLALRGEPQAALQVLKERVLPVFERLGDVRSRAIAMGSVADILEQRGELDEALRIRREEELPVYERLGDVRLRAMAMGGIADVLQQRGALDEALRIRQEEELPVYERLGDVRAAAVTMGNIASILQDRGKLDEALRIRREEELPVYERIGDVRSRAMAMGGIADVLQQRGALDEALRIRQEEELPVYERLGDVRSRAITMSRIADILQQRGELDEALRILREEVLPIHERLGVVRSRAITMSRIADILQQRGEFDEALRIRIEECLPIAEKIGDTYGIATLRLACARLRLERGGWEQGEALTIIDELTESFSLNKKLQRRRGIVASGYLLGHLLAKAGQKDAALDVLDEAAAACDKMNWTEEAAEIRDLQEKIRAEKRAQA